MRLRRHHVAARPPGVPDSPVSIGPNLRALAVYLLVFQHVPVQRCRELICDAAGAQVSAGFIHSCLRKAAELAADVVKLIGSLITAARVAGFDETTLRAGPAGTKKYVLGAFTEDYSLLHLGDRDLGSFRDFGILPDFAGVVVSGRYVSYWHAGWENVAGHQACLSHILRDLEDAAETYPDAHWPAQAQRALRGLIHAWNTPATTAWPRSPPTRPPRWSPSSGAPAPSACPPCPASPAPRTPPPSTPAVTCWNSAATAKTTCSSSPPAPGSGRRTIWFHTAPLVVAG